MVIKFIIKAEHKPKAIEYIDFALSTFPAAERDTEESALKLKECRQLLSESLETDNLDLTLEQGAAIHAMQTAMRIVASQMEADLGVASDQIH